MSENAAMEQRLQTDPQEKEITLLDLVIVLARHKWEILLSTLVAAGIGIGFVLQVPRLYMASVKIIPPTKSSPSTASAILAQLGGGGGGIVDVSGNAYVAMLKSDTVANQIVQKFQLQSLYQAPTATAARDRLASKTTVTASKDGLIKIDFTDIDPVRAANIANCYVEELKRVLLSFALAEAAQRKTYFETQLRQEKDKLTDAQLVLDRTPRTSLNYPEALRNFKFHEGIYDVLIRQYETARLDEAKEAPMVQVLDKADPPENAVNQKRRVTVGLWTLGGLAMGILWGFLCETFVRVRARMAEMRK